jgi:hypothetical protein
MSTPIFDELLREMTEGLIPATPSSPAGGPDADQARSAPPPAQRRRHRAE